MTPNDLLDEVRARLGRGDEPGARALLETDLVGTLETTGPHAELARACEEVGLASLALHAWLRAARAAPDDPEVLRGLAATCEERDEPARALELLEALLARHPADVEALLQVARLLAERREPERLVAIVERARAAGLAESMVRTVRAVGRAGTGGVGTPPPHSTRPEAKERRPPAPSAPAGPEDERTADDLAAADAAALDWNDELAREPRPAGFALPTDADVARFLALFAGREDVHATQWCDPDRGTGYAPIRAPLTPAVAHNHLMGNVTVGVYPIRVDGTVTFFALDIDITRRALEDARTNAARAKELREAVAAAALRCRAVLDELGLPALLEDSGYKGRHLWVFLRQSERAEFVHRLGRLLARRLEPLLDDGLHLEFFPRQPRRGARAGLGNLIKLPLGIHRRTGRRALLLDDRGQPAADPFATLRRVRTADRDTLAAALRTLEEAGYDRVTALRARTGEDEDDDAPEPLGGGPRGPRGTPAPPRPPLPPPAPRWTEADFGTDREVAHLLACCPVLSELRRQALDTRHLTTQEQLVLRHSLGHTRGGALAVNYLFERALSVAPEMFLVTPLAGHPVSCPRVRSRVPHVTARVDCTCAFPFAPDRYPSPLRHLLTLPAGPPEATMPVPEGARTAALDVDKLGRRYGLLQRRLEELGQELTEVRGTLTEALRTAPEASAAVEGGCWQLREQAGVEELIWQPLEGARTGDAQAAVPATTTAAAGNVAERA
jgi:hypothetical protein